MLGELGRVEYLYTLVQEVHDVRSGHQTLWTARTIISFLTAEHIYCNSTISFGIRFLYQLFTCSTTIQKIHGGGGLLLFFPVFRIRISLKADPDPRFHLNADPDPDSGPYKQN